MEVFELKYFLAVAIYESVNRAADEINVSASSLSKAIRHLEEKRRRDRHNVFVLGNDQEMLCIISSA